MFERQTDVGKIHFSQGVIERIIKDAIDGCDGRVFLNRYKGKYMGMVRCDLKRHIGYPPSSRPITIIPLKM